MEAARAMRAKKLEERRIAQVFFQVCALAQILRINLWNRQSVLAKIPGEREECDILLLHGIQNPDSAERAAGEPDDGAPGAAERTLKRPHVFGRHMKMLFKKLL
jgi:hypothetical protein